MSTVAPPQSNQDHHSSGGGSAVLVLFGLVVLGGAGYVVYQTLTNKETTPPPTTTSTATVAGTTTTVPTTTAAPARDKFDEGEPGFVFAVVFAALALIIAAGGEFLMYGYGSRIMTTVASIGCLVASAFMASTSANIQSWIAFGGACVILLVGWILKYTEEGGEGLTAGLRRAMNDFAYDLDDPEEGFTEAEIDKYGWGVSDPGPLQTKALRARAVAKEMEQRDEQFLNNLESGAKKINRLFKNAEEYANRTEQYIEQDGRRISV